MKFLKIIGYIDGSSFTRFEFETHNTDNVNCGDQIWSNGHQVEIADYVDRDNLEYLISLVSNRTAFKGALRRTGFELD